MGFGIFCGLAILFGLIGLIAKASIEDKKEEEVRKATEKEEEKVKEKEEERKKEQFLLRFKNYGNRFNHEELKELYILLNHLGSQKQYLIKYLDFLLQEEMISGNDLTWQGNLFRYWVESELIDPSTSLEHTWELALDDPFTATYIAEYMGWI